MCVCACACVCACFVFSFFCYTPLTEHMASKCQGRSINKAKALLRYMLSLSSVSGQVSGSSLFHVSPRTGRALLASERKVERPGHSRRQSLNVRSSGLLLVCSSSSLSRGFRLDRLIDKHPLPIIATVFLSQLQLISSTRTKS